MSEGNLIQRAQAGDEAAWTALYTRYDPTMRYFLIGRSGRADIDDLLGTLWLRALIKLPGYEDRGHPLSAWLYRIAEGLIIDDYREQRRLWRRTAETAIEHVTVDGPEAHLDRYDAQAQARALLSRLYGAQRRVIELRFMHDRTLDEVAAAMELSKGAVKGLQHRALANLAQLPDEPANGGAMTNDGLADDLLARLWAVGGAWTGEISPWGSYQIIPPRGAPLSNVWCTPAALLDLVETWEAAGLSEHRIAIVLAGMAGQVERPGVLRKGAQ
jgi:RNA polymerase sigma-70 factor (ECF subfamily)